MKKRKIIHKEYQKFINKYNWKGINYPSGKGEWRMFKKSNLTIALKVLNAKKNEYINPPYIILLMILNRERWHYLLVKKLSVSLRGITIKRYGDFYCLDSVSSIKTKTKSVWK